MAFLSAGNVQRGFVMERNGKHAFIPILLLYFGCGGRLSMPFPPRDRERERSATECECLKRVRTFRKNVVKHGIWQKKMCAHRIEWRQEQKKNHRRRRVTKSRKRRNEMVKGAREMLFSFAVRYSHRPSITDLTCILHIRIQVHTRAHALANKHISLKRSLVRLNAYRT